MDNTIRGLWCEFMLAEALGSECRPTGFAWYPWDLQIGNSRRGFPDRIRIQVKNRARMQSWNMKSGQLSDSSFNLTWRRRPFYFTRDNPGVPCEDEGFLCDLYVLCHHRGEDPATADHREPPQWDFYVLPVCGPHSAVTESEIAWLQQKTRDTGRGASTQRRPATMTKGIRGRPPIMPLGIDELSIDALRQSLGLEY
ncbi:hypothetical protein NO357_14115 [Marimonas arenosa]|uniref:Uncharacterized protein n=2 Tax=Marimonas arenosa TaxID=1795305 RepID=A0AAE3WD40_9RHOB|nr:hypothetical protein [Marimonas arenosa]